MAAKTKTKKTAEHPALIEARELWTRYEAEGATIAITTATETLYRRVFGEPLKPCNCRDRIGDALIVIITNLKKTNTTMAERKFIMKRGVVLHYNGNTYTRVNITDDVAAAWSKLYPEADVWERKPAEADDEPTTTGEEVTNDEPTTTGEADDEPGKVVEL